MDIVRNGEREATNYFLGFPGQDEELELTLNHDGRTYDQGPVTGTSRSASRTSTAPSPGWRNRASNPSVRRTRCARRIVALLRPRPRWVSHRDHRSRVVLATRADRIVTSAPRGLARPAQGLVGREAPSGRGSPTDVGTRLRQGVSAPFPAAVDARSSGGGRASPSLRRTRRVRGGRASAGSGALACLERLER